MGVLVYVEDYYEQMDQDLNSGTRTRKAQLIKSTFDDY